VLFQGFFRDFSGISPAFSPPIIAFDRQTTPQINNEIDFVDLPCGIMNN
jgi:hypothetical protein